MADITQTVIQGPAGNVVSKAIGGGGGSKKSSYQNWRDAYANDMPAIRAAFDQIAQEKLGAIDGQALDANPDAVIFMTLERMGYVRGGGKGDWAWTQKGIDAGLGAGQRSGSGQGRTIDAAKVASVLKSNEFTQELRNQNEAIRNKHDNYQTSKNSFIQNVKDQLGNTKWKTLGLTDEIITKEFVRRYQNSGFDPALISTDVAAGYGKALVDQFQEGVDRKLWDVSGNKIEKKQYGTYDQWSYDPNTGQFTKARVEGGEDPNAPWNKTPGLSDETKERWKQVFGSGFSDSHNTILNEYIRRGIDPNTIDPNAIRYFGEKIDQGADQFEVIKGIVNTDPQILEWQLDKDYKEFEPVLDDTTKAEMDNLGVLREKFNTRIDEMMKEATPEIARQVALYGGTDRAYLSNALAKEAGEIAKSREDYLSGVEYDINQNAITRKLLAEKGKFDEARGIQTFQQGLGTGMFERLANMNDTMAAKLEGIRASTMSTLSQQAQNRYNREVEKEQARILREQQEAMKAANKKAAKFGMFSSTLSGMTQGAMAGSAAGPWGALAGGILGGGMGYAQGDMNARNQGYQSTTGSTSSPYGSFTPNYSGLSGLSSGFGGLFSNTYNYTPAQARNEQYFNNRYGR